MSRQRDYTLPDGTGTNDVKLCASAVRRSKQRKFGRMILVAVLIGLVAAYLLTR